MAAEGAYPMNPVVGFDRDPMSHSPSAGEYRFADGSTLYGDDPELYSQVGTDPNMSGGGQGMSYTEPTPAPTPDYYATPPADASAFFEDYYATPPADASAFFEDPSAGMSTPPAPTPAPAAMSVDAESRMDSPEGKAFTAQEQAQQQAAAQAQAKQDFLRTHKAVGYSPGISQEQLQGKATTGVEIPVASTTQVTPGVEDTSADRVERFKQDTKADFQAEERADFEQAKLTNQIAHLKKDEQDINQQVVNRAIERNIAKDTVDKQMGVLDQTEKAYKEHKIDPKQVFGGSTFAEIGAIIAQAGGAYAAILGGGQNYAQQIIDNAIDRNIAVQRLEHEQLGDAADNAYSRFLRMTGDKKDAEEMLRATQHRLAGVERERFAAESGREEVGIALGEWGVTEAQRRQEREVAIRERMMGKVVQSMQSQVAYPKAASGGGYRQKTEDEIRRDIMAESDFETKLASNAASRAESGEKVADASGASGKVKANPLYVEGYGEARTQAEASDIRAVMAQKSTTDEYLDTIEKFIAKNPADRTPKDFQDYNNAVNRIEDAEAKTISGGVGSIQQGEREAAKERGFPQQDYSVPGKVTGAISRALDFGLTSTSKESQLAKVAAIRADRARQARNRINEVVGGKHPEVPEPGVSK